MQMKTPTSPGGREPGATSFTKREGSPAVVGVIDTSLSSRIIRLASERPEFRDSLQPLLYVIAAKKQDTKQVDQQEYTKLMEHGPRFGTISANQGGSSDKNKILRAQLIADLSRLGYRKVSPLQGKWSLLPKDSLLVQNVRPEDLFQLGKKYKQEFVVYQAKPGIMGFYYTKGSPRTRIIVDPKGDTTFRSVSDMTPYSRGKGLDLEWGLLWSKEFAWDGRSPLTRKQVRSMLKREELTKGTDTT